jgi:CobQ-like glutamine amidotransferase family enzyme
VITLLHLYPRELDINGDVGNVMALAKRAQWRGMPLRVVHHEVGAALPETAHLVHIGSGPLSGQELVRDDLNRITPILREWSAAGVPFLAVAGGWQLLGRSITLADGTVLPGVGIFPTSVVPSPHRVVGEVAGTSSRGDVAGFQNHGVVTTLHDGASPFVTVTSGLGKTDGVVLGPSIGTNLHGPLLPMNPVWADALLRAAAARSGDPFGEDRGPCAEADGYAAKSREAIRVRLRS